MPAYDAIVVGLGAMGSASVYHLARRGLRVLGIEQFARGHELGSSHGDSRIIREQYFEHPLYVPLIQRAYGLWRELEQESGKSLMILDSGLMMGPIDGMVVGGTLRSAKEHNLPYELLQAEEIHKRFPAFRTADDVVAVIDPRAGYLFADACNASHLDGARAKGADLRFEEPVVEWSAGNDGVEVRTARGEYSASHLVMTGGGWMNQVLDDVSLPLEVERQVAFWLDPDETKVSFDTREFPIFAYEFKPGVLSYGFPRLAKGVKASIMHDGEITDSPDRVRRTIDAHDAEELRKAIAPVVPHLAQAPIVDQRICLFTNTPDHDFIMDFHPAHRNVVLSSPCSGHGFKFSSVIGELNAELVTEGKTTLDISAFRLDRFART